MYNGSSNLFVLCAVFLILKLFVTRICLFDTHTHNIVLFIYIFEDDLTKRRET